MRSKCYHCVDLTSFIGVSKDPRSNSASREVTPAVERSSEYMDWLSSLHTLTPVHPKTEIMEYLIRPWKPSWDILVCGGKADLLLHPWWNPLNGPMQAWSDGNSPCYAAKELPETGQSRFSQDVL